MRELVSDLVMGSVGLCAKVYLRLCTQLEIRNGRTLIEAISNRVPGTPLITVANHTSTLDDPLLFGILPLALLFRSRCMRWSLGAEEILFTNRLFSAFFAFGRVLPTRRGEGLLQPSMQEALRLLGRGEWIHVFPEGRVVPDSAALRTRLKWGVGRLILESPRAPLLLPIVHQGLEQIKPLGRSLPRFHPPQPLTIHIGEPIDTTALRHRLAAATSDARTQRISATAFVAEQMSQLYPIDR